MLKVLDLFSGIGGFSLGLERTGGFETVAFCEIEPFARRVLNKHWPEVPCFDDVRTLTATKLAANGIAIDVVCGGFPCQDISIAGAGAGLAGSRSSLWFEMLRVIEETRPRWVIIENVPALRSRGLETVLGGLAEVGLSVEWHCIPAAALGAPHRRDRIWIVAYPDRDQLRLVEQRLPARRQVGICDKGQAVSGDDGATQSVADALRHGLQGGEPAIQADMRRRLANQGGAGDVAHPDRDAGHERRVGDAEEGPGGRNADRSGIGSDVADADSQREPQSEGRVCDFGRRPSNGGAHVANTGQPGLPLSERETILGSRWREERRAIAERGWWASESEFRGSPDGLSGRLDGGLNVWGPGWEDGIPRVATGVPKRVDRLRCLGNAIVPQIAEMIGRNILMAGP